MEVKLKTRPDFHKFSRAALGVSLNSRNHEGTSLTQMVHWINDQNTFNECVIDLSDVLHRHNFIADGMNPDQAFEYAYNLGTQWLDNNMHILKNLRMPFSVIRWNHWLKKSAILQNKILFQRALTSNKLFRDAMAQDIEYFLNRRGRQNIPTAKTDHYIDCCYNYLIEELAVHSVFFDAYPAISVYPGRQQKSFQLVRKGLIANVPTGMQKSQYAGLYMHIPQNNNPEQKIAA